MALCNMGKMHFTFGDETEEAFRSSFKAPKKGDMSKRVESLILKDLGKKDKESTKEKKFLEKISNEFNKLVLKGYDSEACSMLSVNFFALGWDKIKQKYKIE